MPETMDEHYRALRRQTDQWQQDYIHAEDVSSGGSGTLEDPGTNLAIDRGTGDQPKPFKPPQAGEGETLAPNFQPAQGEFQSEPPVTRLGKAIGQKGKELAAAIHPG